MKCPVCDRAISAGDERCAPCTENAGTAVTITIDRPARRALSGYRDVTSDHGRFEATYPRSDRALSTMAALLLVTLWTLAWDAGVIGVLSELMRTGEWHPFVLLHAFVGLGMSWFTLASWFNKNVVKIENGVLKSRQGPFTMPTWTTDLELASIESLEVVGNHADGFKLETQMPSGNSVEVTPVTNQDETELLAKRIEAHRIATRPRVRVERPVQEEE